MVAVLRARPPRLRYLGLMGSQRKVRRILDELARLVDGLENVHFFIRPCAAQDVPADKLYREGLAKLEDRVLILLDIAQVIGDIDPSALQQGAA